MEITLQRVTLENKVTFERMSQLFEYDFSEFNGRELNEDRL